MPPSNPPTPSPQQATSAPADLAGSPTQHTTHDGDDFEISNLPAHATPPVWGRFTLPARRWRWLAVALALLLALAFILNMEYAGFVANHPSQHLTQVTGQAGSVNVSSIPTETVLKGASGPTPTAAPSSALALDPPPASCPGVTLSVPTDTAPMNETIGSGAVWIGSFTGKQATLTLSQKPVAGARQYGWPALITVVVRSNFDRPVTITGIDLTTGRQLWWSFPPFDESPDEAPATMYTFTPQHPNPGTPVFWFLSYGTLFLPGSGCYLLQASWPNGGWKLAFVAGR